jgi:TonB family protein
VGAFGAGFGLEFLFLAAILIVPILLPHRMVIVAKNWAMPIVAPKITEWKPQPPPKPVVKKVVMVKPVEPPKPIELPKPKVYDPVVATIIAKSSTVKKQQAPMVETAKMLPSVLGSSAPPTIQKPREVVQTGGFGDPESVKDNHNTTRAPNMTNTGSFDLPTGPGVGNGTAGAKGAKGVVASTGFGDQVAAGNTGSSHGVVQQGGFGDTKVGTAQVKPTSASVDNYKPMELLFVPKPQYTDEARAKKVEGDVVIDVLFSASGEVKVIRVVQGLGYGLDEAAEAAARQIRFRPAQQGGQPTDTRANVRMKCELAY